MPWINQERCIGCEVCINICPVGAIFIKDGKAVINQNKCIRCGKCHNICPQEAVRHDSEKIPTEIEANLDKIKKMMKNFKTNEERKDFLIRMKKYFNKERRVVEQTIKKINILLNK